jgi:hypothetical protein
LTSGPKPHKALRSPTLPPIYPDAVLVDFLNLAPTAEVDLVRDAGDGWSTTPGTWSETAVSNQTASEAIRRVGTLPVTSFLEGVPVHVVANRLGHSDPR